MTKASPTAASAAAMAMEKIATITPVGDCGGGAETPERDEIQVRRGKHQLDADQDEDGVPPAQRREQSDGKQRGGDDEEERECRFMDLAAHGFSSMTRTNPPIKAAVSNRPTHCSGQM